MKTKKVSAILMVVVMLLSIFVILSVPTVRAEGTYNFVTEWGNYGNGDGQFNGPQGIAVDSSGNVFVVDFLNSRIQKFDDNHAFIEAWGSYGSGDGQFDGPYGVAVDYSGNVYVTDSSNNRIQKFTSNGEYLLQWGGLGSGAGEFQFPYGIAVDSSGYVYVSDHDNSRIQKFDSNGVFVKAWGGLGSNEGQFISPCGVAVDSSGNVYVVDASAPNTHIQEFDSNGDFIASWGSEGSGDAQFFVPTGIDVDASNNVFVADTANHRIQMFDGNHNFITAWGIFGSEVGQFSYPFGVAVDNSQNVYVADYYNFRIQMFALSSIPTIYNLAPYSLVTIYVNDPSTTSITQTIKASYFDDVQVTVAKVTMDGADVTDAWGVGISGFSHDLTIGVGSTAVVTLTVRDADGNQAERTWTINVALDATLPVISGFTDGQKVKSPSDIISITISDYQSGVNWNSLSVYLDNKIDITNSVWKTDTGFMLPSYLLTKGQHGIKVTISDLAGNVARARWDVKVQVK